MTDTDTMQLPADLCYRWMSYDRDQEGRWLSWLSAAERDRLSSFGSEKRRREFLLGRATARLLVANRFHLSPAEVPLHVAPDGAVEVEEHNCSLSITHTDRHAVAAVGRRPLGVDLEPIKPRDPGLVRFLMHPDEHDLVEQLPLDRSRALILCWTVKEAALKACRLGLRIFPSKLRLHVDMDACSAVVSMPDGSAWEVRFEEREGYYLAFAYS